MSDYPIKNIVVVGGGTAGWMSAALLAKYMTPSGANIVLVESEEIGTIGVGEATIPHIENYNNMLGIDEQTFLRETQGTFKLGIEFVNWGALGDSYMHPFGDYGIEMHGLPFHHYFGRLAQKDTTARLEDYSINISAAHAGKFIRPAQDPNSLASRIAYAYHLDANLYARYLRKFAEKHGAIRHEGKVVDVRMDNDNGFIQSIQLESGQEINGELFIDCSGFRGLLIEGALKAGYEDWSHYLPMDSAVAVPSSLVSEPPPYTVATARDAGWTWRIPLQHRMGNGHVFSSKYTDREQATKTLVDNIDGELLAEPRLLNFTTGRRKAFWKNNCVAIGLSGGFLEPLESTSIHLIQDSLVRLIALLPDNRFDPVNTKEYNRVMGLSYERIRDFILMHYVVTQRDDSPFWRDVQAMTLPDILEHRIELFRRSGHWVHYEHDLFGQASWLAVLQGQGLVPESYNQLADAMSLEKFNITMQQFKAAVSEITQKMPTHQTFINSYCKAAPVQAM